MMVHTSSTPIPHGRKIDAWSDLGNRKPTHPLCDPALAWRSASRHLPISFAHVQWIHVAICKFDLICFLELTMAG
jgi:hypothetical protein